MRGWQRGGRVLPGSGVLENSDYRSLGENGERYKSLRSKEQ
jgi:hypothetical protein